MNIGDRTLSSAIGFIIVCSIMIILNPFAALIFASLFVIFSNNPSKLYYYTLIVMMAVWISLVNVSKEAASDQIQYLRMFQKVPVNGLYGTIKEGLGGVGREPIYRLFTWCAYYSFGGSEKMFFFAISFIAYVLHLKSLFVVYDKCRFPKELIICSFFIVIFFTQFFLQTLHLIRQFLAISFIIYAISLKIVDGKNHWIWLAIGVFTHTSVMFFGILSLIPWFYKRLNFFQIVIICIVLALLIAFNSIFGGMMHADISSNPLAYALTRFSHTQYDSLGRVPVELLLMVFIPLIFITLKLLFYDLNMEVDYEIEVLYPIIYIGLLLMVFVLSFSKSPLLQYRFFFFIYTFIAFILPLLFIRKSIWRQIYTTFISLFFVLRFFIIHNTSAWHYASVYDIICMPLPYYFITDFH